MRLIDADDLDAKIELGIAWVDEKLGPSIFFDGFKAGLKDLRFTVKNHCPTIDAMPVVWHKVTTRPLTEEEKAYYAEMEMDGIEYIFDCEMPEDGQEILVATKWGTDKDICCNDCDYGIGLEGRGDWDGVYAWAEMPQYKEAEHEAD